MKTPYSGLLLPHGFQMLGVVELAGLEAQHVAENVMQVLFSFLGKLQL